MRRMNRILLSAAMLGISPLILRAADPATQPATQSDAQSDMVAPAEQLETPPGPPAPPTPEDPKSHRGGRPNQHFAALTQKDISDARQFMQEHSPERFKAIEALPDGEKKTNIENFVARAYLNWMRLASSDSGLYSVIVKRVELEDEIFGKVAQLRKEPVEAQEALRVDLKDLVGKLVDNGFLERRKRIDLLEQTVKDERQKLDADVTDRSTVVEARMKSILANDSGGLMPNGGPPMGGGAQPHGRGGPH